ncbi:MAG: winged helix-turn-helix transcriptional regulator [Thermodesulfobacteriota bacterium]|nr:winged helix-turn-helix transcriptional regulator [Thermodesulfobacteriota bacterium]
MLRRIKENPSITRKELASLLNLTVKGIDWKIKQLKDSGILRRIGPDKGGHWEVVE